MSYMIGPERKYFAEIKDSIKTPHYKSSCSLAIDEISYEISP